MIISINKKNGHPLIVDSDKITGFKESGKGYDISFGDDTYYLMDGEKVYMYTKDDNGKWNRTESNKTFPVVGTSLGDVLLDRKSYERGELFRYKTKSGVDTGAYDVVYVQQWGLQYELEAQTENATITMSFGRFGTTRITPPWEQ
jgi:hypothetical protein